MKQPRARGNARETIVQRMMAERGRYAVVLRGSGSFGRQQQTMPLRVAGDVVVMPACKCAERRNYHVEGLQIACGGPGKSAPHELDDLRDGRIPGYALACVIFAGLKPRRWLLADDDGGYTECEDCDDLLATIEARA